MQLKSSFPLSSANSWEKLQGTNSLCGIGVTQRDQRSLELTQERYSAHHSLPYTTQRDDSPASSSSPPSHHGHIRSTWREEKGGGQGCSPVPPRHFASSRSQADPGKEGRWPLVDMSYLSLIPQNAPPLSQDYPGERAGALLSLCEKVWSFHTCLVTPALPSGLPWTVGLAKWQGMAGRQVPRDTERS